MNPIDTLIEKLEDLVRDFDWYPDTDYRKGLLKRYLKEYREAEKESNKCSICGKELNYCPYCEKYMHKQRRIAGGE